MKMNNTMTLIRPPSLDITFEAEKNKPDWSTKISKNLKKDLSIHFLSVDTGKFKGIVFFPKNHQDKINRTLKNYKKQIKFYPMIYIPPFITPFL